MTPRVALTLMLGASAALAQTVPDRPEKLAFSPLRFETPRAKGWRTESIHYADGREETTLFPTVDLSCSMEIYRYDPRTAHEPYSDLRLTLGPRLGIRKEES